MRSVGASHIGKVRTENQDKIFFHDQPVGNLKNLYIVADGMRTPRRRACLFFCSGKICGTDRRIRSDRPN